MGDALEERSSSTRHVRGKALVAKVLTAAISELARLGYEKLSMEDVANAAGVNKTTIYRRWASKRDLMIEALRKFSDEISAPNDRGSFRADLVDQMRMHRDFIRRPVIRGLVRMAWGGPPHEDIAEFTEKIRAEKEEQALLPYMRAIARGELAPETDIRLLRNMVVGAIIETVFFREEECGDDKLERLVDLIVHGARPPNVQR